MSQQQAKHPCELPYDSFLLRRPPCPCSPARACGEAQRLRGCHGWAMPRAVGRLRQACSRAEPPNGFAPTRWWSPARSRHLDLTGAPSPPLATTASRRSPRPRLLRPSRPQPRPPEGSPRVPLAFPQLPPRLPQASSPESGRQAPPLPCFRDQGPQTAIETNSGG